jgi:NTP pyrophosphatase (non-canonical NTP hydrolase)
MCERTGFILENMMDIRQLSAEMHRFVSAKGWYRADSPRPQTPRNIATSLAIEAAEVLEHFQWDEAVTDRAELAAELADVTLYLLQLAALCQIDLEQAVLDKLKVNYTRTWDQ